MSHHTASRLGRRGALASLLVLLALLGAGPAAATRGAQVTHYPLPAGARADGLVAGDEGNLWLVGAGLSAAGSGTDLVGKVTGAGAATLFPLPPRSRYGGGEIAKAADGSLWFTEPGSGKIGHLVPGGAVTEIDLPAGLAGGEPTAILATPSGSIWFTATAADRVVRLGAGGVFNEFPLPAGARPSGVAEGFDGAIWVTEKGRGAIARLAPGGAVTEFPLPRADSRPQAIVAGPDEALWFSEEGGPRIGRILSSGEIEEFPVPVGASGTRELVLGADDNLWYSAGNVAIGSISERGQLGEPACVERSCKLEISSLAKGPNGKLWFGATTGPLGTFSAPSLGARLGRRLGRFAGGLTTAGLSCHGGAAGEYCRGVLRMTAVLPGRGQKTIFRHRYRMAPLEGRRLPLRLRGAARAALAKRGKLRVRLVASLEDGKTVRRGYLLRVRGHR